MLCVVEPDRWLPVLKYSAAADGKKEIAKLVYDLDLPPGEDVVDDRAPGHLEQRPAPLAGRQRHPRPAAGDAVPGWAKNQPAMSRT